jgi:hypothetical protein
MKNIATLGRKKEHGKQILNAVSFPFLLEFFKIIFYD